MAEAKGAGGMSPQKITLRGHCHARSNSIEPKGTGEILKGGAWNKASYPGREVDTSDTDNLPEVECHGCEDMIPGNGHYSVSYGRPYCYHCDAAIRTAISSLATELDVTGLQERQAVLKTNRERKS